MFIVYCIRWIGPWGYSIDTSVGGEQWEIHAFVGNKDKGTHGAASIGPFSWSGLGFVRYWGAVPVNMPPF